MPTDRLCQRPERKLSRLFLKHKPVSRIGYMDYLFSDPNIGSLFLVRRNGRYPFLGIDRSIACSILGLGLRE